MFEKYKVNNLQALIVNYLTAATFSYFFLESSFTIDYIISSNWIFHAIIIGTLFIIVFNLYSLGIQKVGISVTTVANKMSLIIPVCVALLVYPDESLSKYKGIAFVLAIIGIYLSSTKSGKLNFNKKYLWLIFLVFFGQGVSDAFFNDFAQSFSITLEKESFMFFMTLFFMASISGLIIYLTSSFKTKKKLEIKSVYWGIFFGIPNFFSLVFFLRALKDPNISSSEVFPLVSMGVIIISSLIGLFIFNEKITKNNWIGILISICAIFLFSYK
tara:strand:+ start:33742 stop:34557 length:816 start_codon:yes stop_codon:yes gene_type:complete